MTKHSDVQHEVVYIGSKSYAPRCLYRIIAFNNKIKKTNKEETKDKVAF